MDTLTLFGLAAVTLMLTLETTALWLPAAARAGMILYCAGGDRHRLMCVAVALTGEAVIAQ